MNTLAQNAHATTNNNIFDMMLINAQQQAERQASPTPRLPNPSPTRGRPTGQRPAEAAMQNQSPTNQRENQGPTRVPLNPGSRVNASYDQVYVAHATAEESLHE